MANALWKKNTKTIALAAVVLAGALAVWWWMSRGRDAWDYEDDEERRQKAKRKHQRAKKKECGERPPQNQCDGGAWKCKRSDDGSFKWKCKTAAEYIAEAEQKAKEDQERQKAEDCAAKGDPFYWDPNAKDCIDGSPDSSVYS